MLNGNHADVTAVLGAEARQLEANWRSDPRWAAITRPYPTLTSPATPAHEPVVLHLTHRLLTWRRRSEPRAIWSRTLPGCDAAVILEQSRLQPADERRAHGSVS